jgi:hypothetical protein
MQRAKIEINPKWLLLLQCLPEFNQGVSPKEGNPKEVN